MKGFCSAPKDMFVILFIIYYYYYFFFFCWGGGGGGGGGEEAGTKLNFLVEKKQLYLEICF